MRRNFIATAAVALCMAGGPALAQGPLSPPGPVDGTLTMTARSIAAGVGYTWGDGVLYWHHHRYPFTVNGISVADVGYASVVSRGRVYNLHRLEDFNGTYGSAEGNATIVNGIGGQFLQNGNGVQIRIDQVSHGARLTGAADGVQLTLR
ncbi:MAG TPA: hypothetical protein VJY39_09740 [Acidisphaera sp.]|nr:hypothetical protein [Acidisphaera sp.]